MNRALIAPIVALVLMLLKQSFGLRFDDDMSNTLADGILAIIMLIGFFTHPKKTEDKKDEMES